MRNAYGSHLQWRENLYLHPRGRERAMSQTANVEEDRMNPGIRILSLPSANGLLGGQMSGQRSGQLLVLRTGNSPWRRMSHKLANGMKMWKGIGNTTRLLFSLKELEILHQERREQVKTIVMEHFNGILFHKSGPANKQHTKRSISQ
jgi:hypothetical protein